MVSFFTWTYLFYLIPAATGVALLWWLAGKQQKWSFWEMHLLVVPYLVWFLLWLVDDSAKSMGNMLEPALLGSEVIALVAIRVALIRRVTTRAATLATAAILIASAVLIWFLIPEFPETL